MHVADHDGTVPRFAGTFKICIATSHDNRPAANAWWRRGLSQHPPATPPPAFLFPSPASLLHRGNVIGTIYTPNWLKLSTAGEPNGVSV